MFPRGTRPVFDKIAGNFKTLWALCKVTQISAFADNVDTLRGGAPDQFVDITAEVSASVTFWRPFTRCLRSVFRLVARSSPPPQMFRLTDGDILKKCSGAAVAKTTNDGGDHDMELDTCARPSHHCRVVNAVAEHAPA